MKKEYCEWEYDKHHDMYDTSCGNGQVFTDDKVKDNRYKYCPYCGKLIKEISHEQKNK